MRLMQNENVSNEKDLDVWPQVFHETCGTLLFTCKISQTESSPWSSTGQVGNFTSLPMAGLGLQFAIRNPQAKAVFY